MADAGSGTGRCRQPSGSWPLLVGAVITGDDSMRLYFRSPERDRTYGVDVLISHTGPGLLSSLASPAFLANEHGAVKRRSHANRAARRRKRAGAAPCRRAGSRIQPGAKDSS